MCSKIIQISFNTNLVAKRRTSRTLKAILLSMFKLFREKVASLVNIYIVKSADADQLAHNSVNDISAVA